MTPEQARALFNEHREPGDLAHYGEKAAVAAILSAVEQVPPALSEIEQARNEVIQAAYALVMEPGGLKNNGSALVVVEKADKSDPHYRLCTAFEHLERAHDEAVVRALGISALSVPA